LYELTIDVEDCASSDQIAVRAWIDSLMHTDPLTTETELALSRRGERHWTTNFIMPKRGNAVEDSDVFTWRKEWLLGTCEAPD
jgi:hypothetical protein